jgi:hypothetical protein
VESLEIEVSSFGKDGSALGGAALVYDQILSVPDSNFLEDLDLNELPSSNGVASKDSSN